MVPYPSTSEKKLFSETTETSTKLCFLRQREIIEHVIYRFKLSSLILTSIQYLSQHLLIQVQIILYSKLLLSTRLCCRRLQVMQYHGYSEEEKREKWRRPESTGVVDERRPPLYQIARALEGTDYRVEKEESSVSEFCQVVWQFLSRKRETWRF